MYVHSDMATIADIDEPARLYATSKSQQLSSVQVQLSPVESEQRAVQFGAEIPLHLQSACKAPIYLRACLFGLWLAGCVGKAAVQGKLLCRESCCSEFNCLAIWLAG
jgi:hypothetical protein